MGDHKQTCIYRRVGEVVPSGHKLNTYWNLLQEEFQAKSSTFICIQELWGKSKQGDQPLNEWMTKIHNLVVLCGYDVATRDRIVRDVLFFICRSQAAKDRIVCKEPEANLKDVIAILQMEEASSLASQNLDSTNSTIAVHYAKYDSRQEKKGKRCSRCNAPFSRGHLAECKAKDIECYFCKTKGHLEKCCQKKKKDGNSTSSTKNSTKRVHTLSASALEPETFYDEDGRKMKVVPAEESDEIED